MVENRPVGGREGCMEMGSGIVSFQKNLLKKTQSEKMEIEDKGN